MNRKIRNAIIKLLIQYLIENNLYNEDNGSVEQAKKPILILITRKGYWLFRLLYDEWYENGKNLADELGVFNQFTIYSDRFLTKVVDQDLFKGRKILIFDDIMVHGNNLFYYYIMLENWGAEVTPLSLECNLRTYNMDSGDETKRSIYKLLHTEDCALCEDSIKQFWKAQERYKKYRFWLTTDDIADDSVYQLFLFQENLCPMSMDLPIIGEKASEKNKIYRYMTLSKEQWERIKSQKQKWNFVENIENIKGSYKINASFFQANECFHLLSLWGEIQDCIVKCKYQEDENSDKIKVVFVPFVICKSMSYFQVVNLFCELYENTKFEAYLIEKTHAEDMPLKQKLFKSIKEHMNLYSLLYRAIVWYFSIFVGNRFISFLQENGVENSVYDKNFMNHHMQEELNSTICDLCQNTELMETKLSIDDDMKKVSDESDEIDQEFVDEVWNWCFFYLKRNIAEMQFQKEKDFEDIISIDDMENDLYEVIKDCNYAELRYILTKSIVLLQEEGSIGNYIVNDDKNRMVRSGFRPAENGIRIVEESAKEILPYIYAFYLRMGDEDNFINNYRAFMERLKGYLYRKEVFEYHLNPSAFLYYNNFFYLGDEDNEDASISEKMSQVRFLIGDYLNGDTQEYDEVFALVNSWEF